MEEEEERGRERERESSRKSQAVGIRVSPTIALLSKRALLYGEATVGRGPRERAPGAALSVSRRREIASAVCLPLSLFRFVVVLQLYYYEMRAIFLNEMMTMKG